MKCNEIEHRLPAYQDDLLSPEEKKSIERHLASCSRCSRAFADLKKAEALLRDLEEVEPPPFFEQRIMARVREEAGKKQGILRKIFYPLSVKVPIQALATLFIVVLAFHVYQKGEPEMKHQPPLPPPLTEPGKGQVAALFPKASPGPAADTPARQTSAGNLSEQVQQQFAPPPPPIKGGSADRMDDVQDKMREARPSAMKPAPPVVAAGETDIPPAGAQALRKAPEALLPEQRKKENAAERGAVAEERKRMTFAPVAPGSSAGTALKQSVIELTIQVSDTSVAIGEIEKRIDKVNARTIERQRLREGEFLKIEMAAQNIAAFLDQLATIGSVTLEKRAPAVSEGIVTVGVKVVANP